ncbi:helix-turn-helix transcriptional regulator [Paenibacillus assamensis]|uniref:helix-turn-helix transcriptional regulator n=1 Tax=Paenibacillus assamensis TaxID=311244 RepID=UPI0003F4FC39|nr:WYL domain-containing protein [Paenibacillus assamensis]
MAKESFDKEIQFLRMLMLMSGAYNRQQFAERLGISVHTFDKTTRRLKDIAAATSSQSHAEALDLIDAVRHTYYETSDPILLFLFRAKSLKESESARISIILETLHAQTMTAIELMDVCSSMPAELSIPDEKTIRSDLKYLEAVGAIRKESTTRPYRYRLHNDLLRELSEDELTDLFDFVNVMANTQVPSVQGYLLQDGLKKQLKHILPEDNPFIDPFLYKYHYHSRILDEVHLFTLLRAIRDRRRVQFLYFTPKAEKSYTAQQTNPLFERQSAGKQHKTLPLKIVYDHQYGRWYLLGMGREGIRKFRMEGMTHIEEAEAVSEEVYGRKTVELMEKLQTSWLIDTGKPIKVRARFYNPSAGEQHNFIKHRVLLQGQWGEIVEEDEESFIYVISVNGIYEIKPWLRSFGSSCEVLEPRQLRHEMIEEWKELHKYYESI